MNSDLLFPNDGLPSIAAESWVKDKVNVIGQYLSSFAGMFAGMVDELTFVDLYAGNGLYSMGTRKELFPSSALLSLSLDVPISRFVFCESDHDRLNTLKIRVNKYFRGKNVTLLDGKPGEIIKKLDLYVPAPTPTYRSVILCLCDPFSLETPFTAIRKMSEKGFSFLIPFTLALNDRVNYEFYLTEKREQLKSFLGTDNIDRLEKNVDSNITFYKRLVTIYQNNLMAMGFNSSISAYALDSGLMELPAYFMGFYSQTIPAVNIQRSVDATQKVQFDLFDS